MTCNDCNPIRRFFCILACKDANDELCRVDRHLKAENDRFKTIGISIWALIFFIISVVASCELSPPAPSPQNWHIYPEFKYRANQQLKEVP